MITVRFACGHESQVAAHQDAAPVCPECGQAQVRRVRARAPRFVGVATGPYCEHEALEAVAVNLAPKGALVLRDAE